ncbi:MAG: hypothetical protein BM563_07440 [Bacteroidetes bacterium MedPE-SWsnd-G1]|nr:MAG: hypothetical protein BM563_07440 [Bacteroidetes bacterium MedPE-SWsnd-G1]
MKQLFFWILLVSIASALSQEQEAKDSVTLPFKYIEDYTNQLNIKLELSNEIPAYKIPFEGSSIKIKPNLGLRYAFVFNYKWASLRLGIRPNNANDEEKGDPKTFRLKFKLIFPRWSHHFEYNQVKGYYVSDEDFVQNYSNNHFIFPDLKTKVFSGVTAYKFNSKYSLRATESHTEVQLRSAGSFIPSITYMIYGINGLDNYIDEDGNPQFRENFSDNSGFTGILNLAYYYTFVYKKWYASIFAAPGFGYDFRKVTEYNNNLSEKSNHNAFLTSLNAGSSIGFNDKKIYFGLSFKHSAMDFKHSEERIEYLSSQNAYFLFFGYRFKAPKVVTKPINKIEQTIPVLKQD